MKGLKSILICFAVLLGLWVLWIPGSGYAGDELIAVTEVWPPFRISSPDTEGSFTGIDVDILKGLERHLNRKIEIQRQPFARALEMIRTGYADIIPGVAYTDERAKFIAYVPTPYYVVQPVFYTQKNRGHLVESYDDLYKFSVGYSLHSAYFEPFNSDEKIRKVGVSKEEQLLKMVALKRIDITVGTNPNLAYDIKRYGFKDKLEQTRYVPEQNTPVYIGISKKGSYKELHNKINSYLKQIVENGELDRILSQYK